MKQWLHKIEVITDKLVIWMILLLFAVLYVEIAHSDLAEKYNVWITVADSIIVSVFVVDLVFKYIRAKSIPDFLKRNWLDIIAVFPFFFIFRLFEGAYDIFFAAERITVSQNLLHEGIEIEEKGAKLVKEVEEAGKISRTGFFARFLRPILRFPRFLKATPFFEKPSGKHYYHERIKKSKKKKRK